MRIGGTSPPWTPPAAREDASASTGAPCNGHGVPRAAEPSEPSAGSIQHTQARLWRATPLLGEHIETAALLRDGAPPDADVAHDEPWDVWSAIFIPLWAAVGGDTYESVVAGSPTVGMGLLWIYVLLAQARPALVAISAQSPTRYCNATSRRSAAI